MNKKINGYAGKQLRINLSSAKIEIESVRLDWIQDFLGGVGYAVKLLYDELAPNIDPLGRENKLVLSTGPLTMNKVPGGGSFSICFKSPLTEGWGEARAGSDFGTELRRAGFDHIIIEGQSRKPVFLVIDNGKAELRAGEKLRAKTVSEKKRVLVEDEGLEGYQVLSIGPAGENQVRFATIMIDDRAAGRCGGGAVMGSKNILAIAVKGSTQIPEADHDGFKMAVREAMKIVKEHPNSAGFKATGTIGDLPGNDEGGDWPTKNWQSNSWGKGTKIYDNYEKHNFIKPYGCYKGCFIKCGRKVHVTGDEYKTPEHGGAEYESISCFTAYVLNENVDAAVHSTWLCNEQGIDTITAGAMIAFAMECYEKGIISKKDVGNLELSWGNAETLPKMVMMMSKREGLGNILAEGVMRAAQKLGGESDEFAVHVKGLEGPAHDPRSGKALAITYGTASRGMCHIHPVEAMAWDSGKMDFGLRRYGLPDPESVERWGELDKGKAVRILQDGLILPDVLGICKFFMYAGITIDHLSAMFSALTGRDVDGDTLMKIGERVINLQRLFNYREGFTKKDDMLPARVMSLPVMGKYESEPDCAIKNFEQMLSEYYESRGWDPETGLPDETKLINLKLS
jgi:aldehyde:ferredoxin oxidoreductase